MSSYQTEASPAPGNQEEESKKVSFRFCRECSNMLYPLEDSTNQKLMFACRSCQYSEDAIATCVYRNSLKEEVEETAGNVEDVAQDPTVGDLQQSALSSHDFDIQDQGESEDNEAITSLCTLCGQEVTCPFCGEPSDGGIMLETTEPVNTDPQKEQEQIDLERRERALSGTGRVS